MDSNIANYIIKVGVQNAKAVEDLSGKTQRLAGKVNAASSAFNRLARMAVGAFSIYKVAGYVRQATAAYEQHNIAAARLSKVMGNTMNARQEEIQSIQDLVDAQQRLGVVSSGIQLSGAQELATYLTKKSNLEKLIPVMNDMLAQQYGINASQEQAINIAQMMGKVMDGQVGGLSRYGYKFDEAQEKILKYGTEAQRAATLVKVVSGSVGGMNAALAQTPEGRLKQVANRFEDIATRVGSLWTTVKTAFLPLIEFVERSFDKLVATFEANREKIVSGVQSAAAIAITALQGIGKVIDWVAGVWSWFVEGIRTGNPFIVMFRDIIVAATVFLVIYKTAIGAITIATRLWAAAQAILNAILNLNPVGVIIVGIVALIALIAQLCYKIDGWGSLWKGVIGFMKYSFMAYVDTVQLYWNTLVNGIMMGLDYIKLGWYKFKEAVGLGNSTENQAAIARINADVEARQRAIVDGAKKVIDNANKAKESLAGISMSWNSDRSLSDITNGLKSKLGITDPHAAGSSLSGGGNGGSPEIAKSTEAIVTGGTKSTNITINIGNVVEKMTFSNADSRQNTQQMRDEVLDALLRAINMSQAAAQ